MQVPVLFRTKHVRLSSVDQKKEDPSSGVFDELRSDFTSECLGLGLKVQKGRILGSVFR